MNNLNVIILTYNNLDATKKCFENLYKYTNNFNLVVVDNNSTDDTKLFLENMDNDLIDVHLEENNGVILGRNIGHSISRSVYPDAEYTCFLDNDQFVQAGWQESHMEFMNKGYAVVGCEGWLMGDDFYPVKKAEDEKDLFSYVGCGGMMFKNSVIDKIGLFDERFSPMFYEDPDLCFRVCGLGEIIAWNYNKIIEHQPHKLLDAERKVYFNNSWKQFQEKWKGNRRPVFFMN